MIKLLTMRTFLTTQIKLFKSQLPNHLYHVITPSVANYYYDYTLYKNLLQICNETKHKKQANSIHCHILTNGFESNLVLNTKVMIFYAKFGDLVSCRKLFDKMPERNVVSWTALISGYAKNGYYFDALLVFLEMRKAGFRGNQYTFGSVLKACSGMRSLVAGMQVQGCVEKSRFCGDLVVISALVDFYCKCGMMKDGWFLFRVMEEKDAVCWNAMIGGFASQGFVEDSFRMFRSMMEEGVTPDQFTLGSVLKASSRASCNKMVCQSHGFIILLGLGSHMALAGSLIDAYAKCENIRSAHEVYKSMPDKDIISCTALINGYARDSNHGNEALDLFKEIQQMDMHMDGVILCSMLHICANLASLIVGRSIHALSLKCQSNFDVALANALVDMYAKSGEIRDADRAFREMEEKNVISWTSMITAYANHGQGHKAIALYNKMVSEGLTPNDITFLSLLFACSHSGLTSEGWECFNNMISKHDIHPRAEHFSAVVDLLARNGQLEEAYNIMRKMNGKPSSSFLGAILGACKIHGNTLLGEITAKHLLDIDPENSVNYVVLADIYAEAGAWDNSLKVRNSMEERSLKKKPGYSLLHSSKTNMELLQPG